MVVLHAASPKASIIQGVTLWVTIFSRKSLHTERSEQDISRERTLPTHRLCSTHFEGGKKSYVNNEATVFANCAFELLL